MAQIPSGAKMLNSMQEVRDAVRSGAKVFFASTRYLVFEEAKLYPVDHEIGIAQRKMSAVADDKMLVARCKQSWFGGRLHDSEVPQCFTLESSV